MNKLFITLSLGLALALGSCSKDEPKKIEPIEVGTANTNSLEVTREQELMLLLKGGDGKYTAQTLDAKIATASISKDTLRVKGVLNGTTDLVIRSHDQERKLIVKVVPPPFDATENVVTVSPGDDTRTLSLAGGGAKASLVTEGPEKDAATITWDASTGQVRIQAHYEGDVKLIATSEDGKTKKEILVQVRCQGDSKKFGVYKTNARSLSATFPTVLTVLKRGEYVRFSEINQPVTAQKSATSTINKENRVLTIKPLLQNPKVGEELTLALSWLSTYQSIDKEHPLKAGGKVKVIVAEVQDRRVVVRGKGFKLIMPYIKG